MRFPKGFRYGAVYAGIRKAAKPDLALIASEDVASAASVFTTNRVQAAPVLLARKHLAATKGRAAAILVNAGNANCATRTGDAVALATSRSAALALGVRTEEILPASTGVIGVELNPRLITGSMNTLVAGLEADRFEEAASAILTTDTRMKVADAACGKASIAGMTKGSGMIHPRMATTLGFVVTDAKVTPGALKKILARATAATYNRISVDGDTSTNDMVCVLANGRAGAVDEAKFEKALTAVLESLAVQIVRDGEGAKKLITISVEGAKTEADGDKIARSIANSPLVKTAIAGSDPNWGRIICAAGYSGVAFDPLKVDIYLQGDLVCKAGLAASMDEAVMSKKLDAPDCTIRFVLKGAGKARVKFWTCDFTDDYIKINGSYRT
jgi:glutamate N-acetyltransferase/amino-acid N-acetyltransferase